MTASATDRPLEAGTLIATNYRVTKRLGAGGMGTVYLAENVTLTAQKVVVKVLRVGQTGAGQEEAALLASLHHPNVVTVFAYDAAHDCIVMEFLDGSSLSGLLEKGIDRINAIRIGIAVAEALTAVHRRNLVHRDIKPENVMLALNTGSGRLVDWLKLIDFGLALKEGKAPPTLLGTPEYCGPELFYLQEPAHPGNDIYALGVTLFLMLTGTFPFDGEPHEFAQMHIELPAPSLVERLEERGNKLDARTVALLEDLDELVQQMLSKVVAQRPSASEVARRLTKLENSFAEAGTFVGAAVTAVSSEELQPVGTRRTRTGMLRPAPVVARGNDSATELDMPPLEISSRVTPAQKSAVSTDELPPIRSRPERAAATDRMPTDFVDTGSLTAPPARRPPLVAIGGLAAVVLGLIIAVLVLPSGKTEQETPPVPETTPAPPAEKKNEPPPPVVEPVAVNTTPKDAPDELTDLPSIPGGKRPLTPVKKAEVVKAPPRLPPCSWNREAYLEKYQAAAVLLEDPEAFDAEMSSVKKAADCARAEALLQKMKSQAKPR
ncbi:MAG: serine/threonine protein kinase [Archangium sp.]|nr:serine/threonine protein kinase [Archangium sp.]